MYKNILVPVDGSELSEVAFDYAKEIGGRLDTDITILHVVDPRETEFLSMHEAYVDHAAEIMNIRVGDVQKKLQRRPGRESKQISGVTVVGYPPEEILRYADEKDIDLIVMSTHGRSGIRRWVLGSVAEKVLQASTVPVLLARAQLAAKPPVETWTDITIIVPLDGSETAETVLPHVQTLAKQSDTENLEVVVIRVCEPPPVPAIPGPEIPVDWYKLMDENWTQCKRITEQYLAGIEKHLKETGLKVRSEPIEQQRANVAEEIIEYANKIPFSLIAMATSGRSGISRWAYGSVAHKVLMGGPSPILMVRPAAVASTPR